MNRTILLVDDSTTERVVLTGFLKSDYKTIEATSGKEAIDILRSQWRSISAVVLDIIMPEMDGFETLREIKANPIWLNIPVIITTGLDDEDSREKAIVLGADNFVTKPFNQKLLLYIINNAVRLREMAALTNELVRDRLTGLLRRDTFFKEAERMIRCHKPGYYTLSCMDVENFKVINDQYGMEIGDGVLRHVANSLKEFVGGINGLCGRYMADKFAILYPTEMRNSQDIAHNHIEVTAPDCVQRPIRICIGRYLVDNPSVMVSVMFDRAAMAADAVKGRYDTYIGEYNEKMREDLLREQQIVGEMVAALENGEFEPWFQPQYNHATGSLIGAEALVRWRKGSAIIPPNSFIPIFEKNGFIYEVDKSVWRQVCKHLRCWLDEGKEPLPISVNISRYDLFQSDFMRTICGFVDEYDLPIDLLRLEITESAFSDNTKVITQMVGALIERGFTIEIDDFGSGYSSLNTLKDVPASILKLDMRFFEATENSDRGGNIIESVVRMAKWLGMAVIAEGVEDKVQADYLKTIGCYYIQGYYYARPMTPENYEALMLKSTREAHLSRLETIETLDSNLFWDPKSMETLIFNSYAGGACIFEVHNDVTELLRVNDQYVRELHGLVPDGAQLKDSSISVFIDNEERELIRNTLQKAIESGRPASCELHLTDGRQVEYIRFTARMIAKTNERRLYYAVIVNITEQREAEQSAVNNAERISAIMNNTESGITAFVISPEGEAQPIFINNRFYELLGFTQEQFQAEVKTPVDFIWYEDRDVAVSKMIGLQQVGQSADMQIRAIRRDGSMIWLRVDISIVSFANVSHPVQLSNFLDVTEQIRAEQKRIEAARQLQAIMGNVNGSVSAFTMDDAGNTTPIFCNEKYYEIYGYTREEAEAIQLDVISCVLPEDFDHVLDQLNRLKQDGVPIDIDFRARKRDGSVIFVRSIASRMSMEGYDDQVIVAVDTDFTEQHTLQDQLTAIIENINGGVSVVHLRNNMPEFLLVNDEYFEIIGYTKEQFYAELTNAFDLVHPDDRERIIKLFTDSAAEKKRYTMEYRIVRRNGAIRHVVCNSTVMDLFGVEEPVQLSVVNDITMLREAQQKERALSAQMQVIMQNIHGGVTASVFHDKNNVEILFTNDGFYELYGYTQEQFETELPNILDLILPEDREKTMETVERIFKEHGCETYEYRCRKRDGSIMWTQVTNGVISLEDVSDTVLLSIVTDITQLRLTELENIAMTDKLRTVMNAMTNGVTAVALRGERTQFLFANNRYYEMHGFNQSESNHTYLEDATSVIYPEDRERVRTLVLSVMEVGQSKEIEYRVQLPDGVVRWEKAVISVTQLTGVDVPVQVTIYTDISAEKAATDKLCFLNEIARTIIAQPDVESAISEALTRIGSFFGADRSYVVELDKNRQVSNNTYEECAFGIESQKFRLQALAYTKEDFWFEALTSHGYLIIDSVEAMDDEQADWQAMLLRQDIHALILVALQRDGELIGFVGMDNPDSVVDQVQQLIGVANNFSMLLLHRDMARKIAHDNGIMQVLMNDTPGGFLRMQIIEGKNPHIISFNAGFCKLLAMTSSEIMATYGNDTFKCIHPEDLEAVSAENDKAFDRSGQYTTKCRLKKKDGEYIWAQVFGRFVKGENGELFLNAYFTDITEQKKVEEYQIELLDNLPSGAGLYEYDGKDFKVIHINRRYWELVGREAKNYGKASPLAAIHPDDRGLIMQEIESAIRQHRDAAADCRLLYGDGGYRPFHITAKTEERIDGRYLLYVSYMPVSDETMSIQELLPIALSTMVTNSSDFSYVKDNDLRYICVSQSIADMAGIKNPRDFIGRTAEDFFSDTFADKFSMDDRHVIKTGESVKNTLEHLPQADGSVCLARTSKFPILDTSGNTIGVYCISRDITAQKERESQLELLTSSIPGGLAAYSISPEGLAPLYFNDGFYAYSGYTREEYQSMTEREPLALMFEEDRPRMLEMVRDFVAKKQDSMTGSCVYRCKMKNGGMRWMSMKAVLSQVGEDAYILHVVQLDVTDQMETDTRRAQLLDNLPFGAALFNYDGEHLTPIHFNRQYRKIVNGEWTGPASALDPVSFIHPDDRQVVFDEIKDAIAHGRNGNCEVRLLFADDEYRSFRLDANIVPNNDGTYLLYVAYTLLTEQELSFRTMLPLMFERIMESSTDLAFAKDINFRYICCSKTFAQLLGLKSEKDVVGKTDYELFPKQIADILRKDDSALFATGKPLVDIQEILPSPDGTAHYIRTTKHLLSSVTGEVFGIYCTGRDVTEVRDAYAQLKLLTDSLPGGIAKFRCMPGNIELVFYSDGICSLAGYSREEFQALAIPMLDFVLDEDRPVIHEQIERLMAGETNLDFTFRIHARDGIKWVNSVAHTTDHIGDVYNVSAVLTDATAQQEEKERLYLANEEYRIATLHSNRTISRYNIAAQTLSMSSDAAKRLELPELIPGVPYERVKLGGISEETQDAYITLFEDIMRGEKEGSAVFCKLLPSGWRWIEANYTTVFDADGKPFSAIISFIDITEQRKKEAIYSRWQNSIAERPKDSYTLFRCNISKSAAYESWDGELMKLTFSEDKQTFDERTDDFIRQCVYAEDRDRYRAFMRSDTMLAEFYRGHRSDSIEFREYLPDGKTRWLRLSVDLVEYPNSPDVQAYLMFENIDEEKRAQQKIIERAETDPLTGVLNRATFAVRANRIMSESKPDVRHALLMLDIDGFKMVNDVFGHGAGDQTLIEVADILTRISRKEDLVGRLGGDEFIVFLQNVSNEMIVAKKAQQICELIRKNLGVNVRISASIGIAMYPQDGEGFETLYKAADDVLYKVKDTGKNGYAFTHDAQGLDELSSGSPEPRKDAQKAHKTLRRILIVDDNRLDMELLSKIFMSDFRIEKAADGTTALSKLRRYGTAISAVLLDLHMPDMDGFEVLRRIQQDEAIHTVPVIVVSADEQRETALRVISAGADDLIVKPVDSDILRVRVEAAIKRSENERLRTQSSFLALRNAETSSYKSALERYGIMVISLDWGANEFSYSPTVSERLAGEYDGKILWRVLLSNTVTDSHTVQNMQQLVHDIAGDRARTEGNMTVKLKTTSGVFSQFEMNVFKEIDDYGLADKIIITLREITPMQHGIEEGGE